MTGRSLLAEALADADRYKHALERVLTHCERMDHDSSARVRNAAHDIRNAIAQKEGK